MQIGPGNGLGTFVASYIPGQPVRVVADVDMTNHVWRVAVGDNPAVSGLPFVQDIQNIRYLGSFDAFLQVLPEIDNSGVPVSIAYDDIKLSVPLLADLVVPAISATVHSAGGGGFQSSEISVVVTASVTNRGVVPATGIRVLFDVGGVGKKSTVTKKINLLAPNETQFVSSGVVKRNFASSFSVKVAADPADSIPEQNESNNIRELVVASP